MKVHEIRDMYKESSASHLQRFIDQYKPIRIISVNEKLVKTTHCNFPWKELVITIIYE